MRAFIPNDDTGYEFPEDMKMIMAYLNEHGKVLVEEKLIEQLYRCFSEDVFAAQWMLPVEETTARFAEWLAGIDICHGGI